MQTYKFHFCGSSFKVKTDNNEDVVKAVKGEIEKKIQKTREIHKDLSLQKTLMLVCFSFSEEMFFLKKAVGKNLSHLESETKSLLKDLESSSTLKI